ncbi:hypothetical protein HDU98_004451 [Podochytrium sp. JEL0797]|nr:hypothetical protein HDU98_004449 [Podochytrium sp. JEL0797]KAJ3072008.1 hypothetical protein HDU98_004451 [Podochytrium sp. JEL0797]
MIFRMVETAAADPEYTKPHGNAPHDARKLMDEVKNSANEREEKENHRQFTEAMQMHNDSENSEWRYEGMNEWNHELEEENKELAQKIKEIEEIMCHHGNNDKGEKMNATIAIPIEEIVNAKVKDDDDLPTGTHLELCDKLMRMMKTVDVRPRNIYKGARDDQMVAEVLATDVEKLQKTRFDGKETAMQGVEARDAEEDDRTEGDWFYVITTKAEKYAMITKLGRIAQWKGLDGVYDDLAAILKNLEIEYTSMNVTTSEDKVTRQEYTTAKVSFEDEAQLKKLVEQGMLQYLDQYVGIIDLSTPKEDRKEEEAKRTIMVWVRHFIWKEQKLIACKTQGNDNTKRENDWNDVIKKEKVKGIKFLRNHCVEMVMGTREKAKAMDGQAIEVNGTTMIARVKLVEIGNGAFRSHYLCDECNGDHQVCPRYEEAGKQTIENILKGGRGLNKQQLEQAQHALHVMVANEEHPIHNEGQVVLIRAAGLVFNGPLQKNKPAQPAKGKGAGPTRTTPPTTKPAPNSELRALRTDMQKSKTAGKREMEAMEARVKMVEEQVEALSNKLGAVMKRQRGEEGIEERKKIASGDGQPGGHNDD